MKLRRWQWCVAVVVAIAARASAQQGVVPAGKPGAVLVKFQVGQQPQLPQGARAQGFELDRQLFRVDHPSLTTDELLSVYRRNPNVRFVEPDVALEVFDTNPTDPLWPQQWDMVKIGSPQAWDLQKSAASVVVMVIDTGVDFTHPDLSANIWTGPTGEHGYTCINGSCVNGGLDDHGHGTHVAGTIGAQANNGQGIAGINWTVQIVACKFLSSTGSGAASDAIRCFDKATSLRQQGVNVRVTNNSWGGVESSQALKDAMARAEAAGVVNVCAAGNSSANSDTAPMYPAAFDNRGIISVLATDNMDRGASFSNYGLASVDIAAPGVSTLSTAPMKTCALCDPSGYKFLSGTSMAAPHVTGVVAALFQKNPSLSAYQARDLLLRNYDAMTDARAAASSSGGRLNLYKVLTAPDLANPALNGFPVIGNFGGSLFLDPGQTANVSVSASDPDGDRLRTALYGSASNVSGRLVAWLAGRILVPNDAWQITAPATPHWLMNSLVAAVADGRGGSAISSPKLVVSRPGTPPPTSGGLAVTPSTTTPKINEQFSILSVPSNLAAYGYYMRFGSSTLLNCCFTGAANLLFNGAGTAESSRVYFDGIDWNGNLVTESATIKTAGGKGEPPTARVVVANTSGVVPWTFDYDLRTSSDSDGSITDYVYNCPDGNVTIVTTGVGRCTITQAGNYALAVGVRDNDGNDDRTIFYVAALPGSTSSDPVTPPPPPPPPPPADTQSPAVKFISPKDGSTVSGSSNLIQVASSDNIGVVQTDVYIQNTLCGTGTTSVTCRLNANSYKKLKKILLTAVARDAAGNTAKASVTVYAK